MTTRCQALASAAANTAFSESAASAIITVSLTAASGLTATVQFATSAGSATAGGDYVPNKRYTNLTPGMTQTTATIPILPDSLYEGPETFGMALTNPAGADLAAPFTATHHHLGRPTGADCQLHQQRLHGGGKTPAQPSSQFRLSAPSALTAHGQLQRQRRHGHGGRDFRQQPAH